MPTGEPTMDGCSRQPPKKLVDAFRLIDCERVQAAMRAQHDTFPIQPSP